MLDFPPAPVPGETYGDWIWDGVKWTGTAPAGPPGQSGFTETTTQFTVPQVGGSVDIFVADTSWAQPGAAVFIAGMVAMVQVIDPPFDMTLIRLQDELNPDTIVNTVIPAGTTVSPAGFPGPIGPTGLAPLMNVLPSVATAADLPTTGNCAGDARIALDTNHVWFWDGNAWIDLGAITTGPEGPPGAVGPPGPAGPSGSSETGPWLPIVLGPGWSAVGNTLMCRMQLNGQQLQFKGGASASPAFTTQISMGSLPAGITSPIDNRFVPIIGTTSAAPGYAVLMLAIVPGGALILVPPFGAPSQGYSGVNVSCTVPLDAVP